MRFHNWCPSCDFTDVVFSLMHKPGCDVVHVNIGSLLILFLRKKRLGSKDIYCTLDGVVYSICHFCSRNLGWLLFRVRLVSFVGGGVKFSFAAFGIEFSGCYWSNVKDVFDKRNVAFIIFVPFPCWFFYLKGNGN